MAKELEDFRKEIDALDKELVKMLGKRQAIVSQVALYKHARGIPAILQDRIDEVRNNAAEEGKQYGLDPDYTARLWQMMIDEACRLEQEYFDQQKKA